MKNIHPAPLSLLIFGILHATSAVAKVPSYCPTYESNRSISNNQDDFSTLPVYITAENLYATYPTRGIYTGDVFIEQGQRTLKADQAEVTQTPVEGQLLPQRMITAEGNVVYTDSQFQLLSPRVQADVDKNDVDIGKSEYRFVDAPGRGVADSVQLRDGRYATMRHGDLTLCPPGDNSWSIKGTSITHDKENQVAEIWNAVFKIGPVPVFYSPYLQFPTSNQRRTGLLIPSVSYGKRNGTQLTIPYYWNIAPNVDATFTTQYISHRGVGVDTEVRYLAKPYGSGTVAFNFLPNDKIYKKESLVEGKDDNRWLFFWRHNALINQVWRFNADFTKVSDNQYFSDFNSIYGSQTDGYATQRFSLGYTDSHWDTSLSMRRFQVFNSNVTDIYKTMPQFDATYTLSDIYNFDFSTYFQASRFLNINDNEPSAWRLHVEPKVNYSIANNLGDIDVEAGVMMTHYDQDIPDNYRNPLLKSHASRIMPNFKIDGKMVFERDMTFFDHYTQTLEPRVQYRYMPYRDQSDIKNYDSVLLQSDYARLFGDSVYSGLDRIASANQVTTGLTTRIYDNNLIERFNASIGQVYYFTESRTGDINSPIDRNRDSGSLTWAFDSYWKFNDELSARGGVQYDTRIDEVALSNVILEYQKDESRLVQLSYRYVNKAYITALDLNRFTPYKQNISQAGIMASWPLTENILAVGAYYYDTQLKQSVDSFIGLQYYSCCWGINVTYGRRIDGWDKLHNQTTYDNKVSVNFELLGLSNSTTSARKLLNSGIIPYQKAF